MRVLLVDHDSEALEAIARAIRGVIDLDCVTSKGDALLLLRQNTYDVLIACERAVDGSGLDLLGRTTRTTVPLKRIFAAAPERLQLLGPRLAPFKVQRTIGYPIDLEELWLAIAQVTGTADDTDGTIERVVLDERGIPAVGSVPRAPIPPRPATAVAAPAVATGARAATARAVQPAPEPAARVAVARAPQTAPAPPRTTADTGRMRAPAIPPAPPRTTADTGRMRAPQIPPPPAQGLAPMTANGPSFPAWTPELAPEDDFAEVAAQARLGVQQKSVDETARRRRQRLIAASGIAVAVAGTIVFLIEKFYDPEATAREQAIAAEVARMAEQQKLTDELTLIEIDIENAIMNNDLEGARQELARLVERSPDHPRREFLRASIDRAAELQRLSTQSAAVAATTPAEPESTSAAANRRDTSRTRPAERPTTRNDRVAARTGSNSSPGGTRAYGAPIGEAPAQVLPLNAPINAEPVVTLRRADNAFSGRTLEAGDSTSRSAPPPPPSSQTASTSAPAATPGSVGSNSANAAGSANVAMPNTAVAKPQPSPPAPVDVVPAKIVRRVTPVVPPGVPRKTSGYVVVRYSIGTDGRVSDLDVVESQPQGVFDEAAQDAVRKWIYEPRKENGVAVASTARARLVFDAN